MGTEEPISIEKVEVHSEEKDKNTYRAEKYIWFVNIKWNEDIEKH